MSWGMVVAAGATLIGGAMSNNAAGDAADAQSAASNAATAEQRRQYDQTRQDNMPWLNAGGWALGEQQNFLKGDFSAALKSPDYLAAKQEGLNALDYGATAGGNLWGGGADADRIRFGSNLATQQIGNYYNRLAGMSNTGQTTAGQLGQFGANAATNIGQNMIGAGQARASSYTAQANNWNNMLQQGAGMFNQWQANRGGG